MNDFLLRNAEKLMRLRGGDRRWEAVQPLISELGFDAVVVVSGNTQTQNINWARSTMNGAWMKDYIDQDFFDVDPMTDQLFSRRPFLALDGGVLRRATNQTTRLNDLAGQAEDAGYGRIFCFSVGGVTANENRTVALASSAKLRDLSASLDKSDMQSTALWIGNLMAAPENPFSESTYFPDIAALSPREIDVLSYLARGLRNDAIAEKLHISEVTVRLHLTSARKKLKARTREEALVKAMQRGAVHI